MSDKDRVVQEAELKFAQKNGELRIWEFSLGPLGVDETGLRMNISMALDITERKALEKQLKDNATRDNSTKLANRAELMRSLENAVSRANRYDYPVSLLFIDLDDFKQINNTHGDLVGDQLLIEMAKKVGKLHALV